MLTSSWLGAPTHRTATTRIAMVVQPNGVRAREGVCARDCVCTCVRDVFAIHDNNILPRLIIKIIFIYFIEIAHTDDFPLTGTRVVLINLLYILFTPAILIIQ